MRSIRKGMFSSFALAAAWVAGVVFLGAANGNMSGQATQSKRKASENCWRTVASMPTARFGLAAAAGLNGKIYALGGSTDIETPSRGVVDAVEVYDPDSGVWAPIQPMPTARVYLLAATDLDGRIYAIGGVGASVGMFLNIVERYDPRDGTWSPIASLPGNRCCLGAATGLDGRIYAIGGFDGAQQQTVYTYDPLGPDVWDRVTDLPSPRAGRFFAATHTDGTIYAIGGIFPDLMTLGTVEAYEPSSQSWTTRRTMPTPRRFLDGVVGQDGRFYVIGGTYGISGFPGPVLLPTVEAYDPNDDSWSLVTSLPTARGALAAAIDLNGTIYAIGGWDGFDVLASVVVYQP